MTLTNGTVNGAFSTINALTVANSVNNVVSNGNNGTVTLATPLNIGALTFNGAATLNPVTSPTTASTPALAVTTLTASGAAGSVKVSPISTIGGFPNGTYQLVSYTGSIGGTGFPAFSLSHFRPRSSSNRHAHQSRRPDRSRCQRRQRRVDRQR